MRVKNVFYGGKMNTDVDERHLKKGEYRFAKNVNIISSDGSDVGAIENIKGTVEVFISENFTNSKILGALKDDSRELFYSIITSDEKDAIIEYDIKTGLSHIIAYSLNPNGVLNFDKSHLITGIVKVVNDDKKKDLLIFTDDFNGIRSVNIERMKQNPHVTREEQISLIKKSPRYPLKTQLTYTSLNSENYIKDKFLSFGYRYKYLDGEYSPISSFTYYQFNPSSFNLNYISMENLGMENSFNAIKLFFNTGEEEVTDIELIFKESNSNALYVINSFNKKSLGWGDDEEKNYVFSNGKKYKALPEKELFRDYDNIPRVAKTLTIAGNRLIIGNYVEGYDLTDKFGNNINPDFDLGFSHYSNSGQLLNYTVSTSVTNNDVLNIDFTGIPLNKGVRLTFNISLNEYGDSNTGIYKKTLDFILPEIYNNIQDLSINQDFIYFINEILTNGFKTNFVNTPPTNSQINNISGFSIVGVNGNILSINTPVIHYDIYDTDTPPNVVGTEDRNWEYDNGTSVSYYKFSASGSVKTNRNYEAVIKYYDKWGRASTGINSLNNSNYLSQKFSVSQNKIVLNINHKAPVWADRYKIAIKQNKGEYFTVYTNLIYEDPINKLYRWVKLEGENKNKVKEGDTLIVKSDYDGVIEDIIRVKVLEVSSKPSDFLDNNGIKEESGLYMRIRPVGFNANANESEFKNFSGSQHLKYPSRTYTEPSFGTTENGVFTPYPVKAGSRIRIKIDFKLRGNEGYHENFDKTFRAGADYDSIKEWFDSEVRSLGQFGREYTWDGVTPIWDITKGTHFNICGGHNNADVNNRFSGWGFGKYCEEDTSINTESPEHFFVVPHRMGYYETSWGNIGDRNVTTHLDFDVFFSNGDLIFETEPKDSDIDIFYETEEMFDIVDGNHQGNIQNQDAFNPAIIQLGFFNCYVQGNGAETYRYKDSFNGNYLGIDTRPTGISDDTYKEVRRLSDLTYSETYNESTNINGLNVFNLATVNYKDDIDKQYGSIQHIRSRDMDLLLFQEDKISKVLFGKDLLMNADGTYNITAIPSILGRQLPYSGEYGISDNPESSAHVGRFDYFTDARRGKVLRLGGDGITEISSYGMKRFFSDNFKLNLNSEKIGEIDPIGNKYILSVRPRPINNYFKIKCDSPITLTELIGDITVEINFDNFTELNQSIKVLLNSNISGRNIEFTYNGITTNYQTINDLTGLPQEMAFLKDVPYPNKALLKILSAEKNDVYVISPVCINNKYKVVTVVLGDDTMFNKSINNKYLWKKGDYVSQINSHFVIFGNSEISVFEESYSNSGMNTHPSSGSIIKVESVQLRGNTASPTSKIGYLISNQHYDISLINNLISDAIFPTTNNQVLMSGDKINSIEFDFIRTNEQYLYLIFDYRKSSQDINNVVYNIQCDSQPFVIENVTGNITINIDYGLHIESGTTRKLTIESNVGGRDMSFELGGNITNYQTYENYTLSIYDEKVDAQPTIGTLIINNVEITDSFTINPNCVIDTPPDDPHPQE